MIKELSLKLNEEIKATKQFQEYQSLAKQVKKNETLKKQEALPSLLAFYNDKGEKKCEKNTYMYF